MKCRLKKRKKEEYIFQNNVYSLRLKEIFETKTNNTNKIAKIGLPVLCMLFPAAPFPLAPPFAELEPPLLGFGPGVGLGPGPGVGSGSGIGSGPGIGSGLGSGSAMIVIKIAVEDEL